MDIKGKDSAAKPVGKYGRQVSLTPEQRRSIPPFAALRAFEAIGALGGIRRAATALSIDHAAISRHLRALEQWTGTPLIDRNVAGQLTEQGRIYHQRVASALSELARATQDLQHDSDETMLRLWCVPGLASEWLTGRIGAFTSRHQHVEIELQPSDFPPNFDVHQADAYVGYTIDGRGAEPDPKLRYMEIARPQVVAVASADYLATCPKLATPADLMSATLLHESNNDQWRRWFVQHNFDAGTNIPGPKFWQGHLTMAAARRGQGIALTNILLAEDDLRSGRLVKVGDWQPVYLGSYFLSARRDSWTTSASTNFRRWLEKSITESLTGVGRSTS